jgi:hypothetical protein
MRKHRQVAPVFAARPVVKAGLRVVVLALLASGAVKAAGVALAGC